jgi:hypothetical protein
MGDVYALVNKARTKFPQGRITLSGVRRRRDVSWRRIGAFKMKLDSIPTEFGDRVGNPETD